MCKESVTSQLVLHRLMQSPDRLIPRPQKLVVEYQAAIGHAKATAAGPSLQERGVDFVVADNGLKPDIPQNPKSTCHKLMPVSD